MPGPPRNRGVYEMRLDPEMRTEGRWFATCPVCHLFLGHSIGRSAAQNMLDVHAGRCRGESP